MFILSCRFYIAVPWAKSLKDKRRCIKSLTDRLGSKFNISVAEVGENDNHTLGEIGLCMVSNSKNHLTEAAGRITDFAQSVSEGEIYGIETEVL